MYLHTYFKLTLKKEISTQVCIKIRTYTYPILSDFNPFTIKLGFVIVKYVIFFTYFNVIKFLSYFRMHKLFGSFKQNFEAEKINWYEKRGK